jgi:hypothetical protein
MPRLGIACWIMSGSEPAAGWAVPGQHETDGASHVGPAVASIPAWKNVPPWPPSSWPPLPPRPPGRLACWLASPAAAPLLVGVAAVTAAGWIGAAALMASILATGHPVPAAVTAVIAAGFVIALVDAVTAIGALAYSSRRPAPSRPAGIPRALRDTRRRPGIRLAMRGRRRVTLLKSLPRPVRLAFTAAAWPTGLAFSWSLYWIFFHAFPGGHAGATALGQQLTAAAFMAHCLAWCAIACKRVNRIRTGAITWHD